RAVLRRWDGARAGTELVRAGDLTLDLPRMQATLGGRVLALTPTEFQLLAVLARQPGRVFTRGQLLEAVRGVALESYERAIDSHIKNIRRKLEPEPHAPRYVLAVHGIGYKLADV
ncbi:MAG TPA: response regulator transcription factor, partial [bacterium]|nr:response regulator transcription factor [bacterium]